MTNARISASAPARGYELRPPCRGRHRFAAPACAWLAWLAVAAGGPSLLGSGRPLVCRSQGSAMLPAARMSREEVPTMSWYVPGAVTQRRWVVFQ